MRKLELGGLAVLAMLCSGASPAGKLYVKAADSAFAAGRWGEAMVTYDAAHDDSPGDAVITAHRRDAAAKWVEATALEVGKATPPEKALILLRSLAEQGNRRGADAAVKQHVVPLLDSAVLRAWNGDEPSDDPKALWQVIRRGELLTQSLPEGSAARMKLAALRQRGATLFGKLAQESKHPASAYLYGAMAARMTDAKPGAAIVEALRGVTEFDYQLSVAPLKSCPEVEPEFRKRLAYFAGVDRHAGRPSAKVDVSFDCVPLAPPKQRQESRSWVATRIESTTVPGSCTNRQVLVNAGSHTETTSHGTGIGGSDQVRIVDVPTTYKTVPDCDPPKTYSRTITENKTDLVTITTEERGLDARGSAVVVIDHKGYRMPLSSRAVAEKITTEGRIFGSKEEGGVSLLGFPTLVGHGIALEMVYLLEQAREGYVADLVKRAAGEPGDARLGNMVSAVRIHQRVTKDYAQWFADSLGFEEQDLKELVLDSPRIKMSLKVSGDYRLDLPKVDPSVAREAAAKKRAAGTDDFK